MPVESGASSAGTWATMLANRRVDTKMEKVLRSELHLRSLRFRRVLRLDLPGGRGSPRYRFHEGQGCDLRGRVLLARWDAVGAHCICREVDYALHGRILAGSRTRPAGRASWLGLLSRSGACDDRGSCCRSCCRSCSSRGSCYSTACSWPLPQAGGLVGTVAPRLKASDHAQDSRCRAARIMPCI